MLFLACIHETKIKQARKNAIPFRARIISSRDEKTKQKTKNTSRKSISPFLACILGMSCPSKHSRNATPTGSFTLPATARLRSSRHSSSSRRTLPAWALAVDDAIWDSLKKKKEKKRTKKKKKNERKLNEFKNND